MKKILFIDSDKNALRNLRKQLHSMQIVWDMFFVESGKDALKLMESASFDVAVSEMNMPEMNGVELFDIIIQKYPETVRIMHSENTDSKLTGASVRSSHQFLMKPCSPDIIKCTIERTCKLQDLTNNEKLKQIITGVKNLPSLPRLYNLITREMQSPDPSLAKIGTLISQDISLSAKILQLVNSAYYSLPQKITDPEQATIYLGSEVVKTVVLSNHVFSSFVEDAEMLGVDITQMWNHSMQVGVISGVIARTEQAEKDEVEDAMISGVLHDIGKLILLKAPKKYKEIISFMDYTGSDFVDAEYAVLKTSHAEMGAYLLGLWGIPDSVVEIVAFHHGPSSLIENVLEAACNSSGKNKNISTPTGGVLKSKSVNEYIKGLTALASVHTANALVNKKNGSSETTDLANIDMLYLKTLKLEDRLPIWEEAFNNEAI
ncbi:MAG: HDOD domain-containing protein [Candidatus Scalindua sp.]|nr:HDOD domain-containing protein [Candidatus Scalindua sp.]